MATKKKIDVLSIIVCAVLFVCTAVAIVGICIAWMKTTISLDYVGSSTSSTSTLSDWLGVENSGVGANAAFAHTPKISACRGTFLSFQLIKYGEKYV